MERKELEKKLEELEDGRFGSKEIKAEVLAAFDALREERDSADKNAVFANNRLAQADALAEAVQSIHGMIRAKLSVCPLCDRRRDEFHTKDCPIGKAMTQVDAYRADV